MGNSFLKSSFVYKARDSSEDNGLLQKLSFKNCDVNVNLKFSRSSRNKLGVYYNFITHLSKSKLGTAETQNFRNSKGKCIYIENTIC